MRAAAILPFDLKWCWCNSCPTQGTKEAEHMKWRTPKIVEIACGGEINAYFPAEL